MRTFNKAWCMFEQSGTFKNEFIKLGIPAVDLDIQNNFGETDYVIDLFDQIDTAYAGGGQTVFDKINKDDITFAFFPCIHFCDAKTLIFQGVSMTQKKKSLTQIVKENIGYAKEREYFFEMLLKLCYVFLSRGLNLVIENPYNWSGMTYLENNFFKPTVIDKDRTKRGDYFIKPTGYWFFNFDATYGTSFQSPKERKTVMKCKAQKEVGMCSEERSMISEDYARNFICDFILGKEQEKIGQGSFNFE